jgi:hypothetical protein
MAAGLFVAIAVNASALAQQSAPSAAAASAATPSSGSLGQAKSPAPNVALLRPNVLTVEALIKTENELALAKEKKDRMAAGLDQQVPSAGVKPKAPVRMAVDVESIAGLEGRLRAYLSANGQQFENVGVGAKVLSCEIEAIQNRCVVFKPAARGVKPEQCPTACWTGLRIERPVGSPAGMQPAAVVPMPGGPFPAPAGASMARPMPVPTAVANPGGVR